MHFVHSHTGCFTNCIFGNSTEVHLSVQEKNQMDCCSLTHTVVRTELQNG